MLKLLLDEHISHDIATGFRSRFKGIPIVAVDDFDDRRLVGLDDPELLTQASKLGFTLVTYDLRTILPLLKEWASQGHSHGGVIFADQKTLRPDDFGGLNRALGKLARAERNANWTDRVVFLKD